MTDCKMRKGYLLALLAILTCLCVKCSSCSPSVDVSGSKIVEQVCHMHHTCMPRGIPP